MKSSFRLWNSNQRFVRSGASFIAATTTIEDLDWSRASLKRQEKFLSILRVRTKSRRRYPEKVTISTMRADKHDYKRKPDATIKLCGQRREISCHAGQRLRVPADTRLIWAL
jgi:hypothetical protein